MDLSVIVPTFNEGENVAELVRRIGAALGDVDFEIVFVDDSTDDTPATIAAVARATDFPVRVIHRDAPEGGLSGAVLEGFRSAQARWCLVMDGDLQHPPEDIPRMLDRAALGDVDIVVASRYVAGGTAGGLAGATRTAVSRTSTLLTKAMFPRKLHGCTDPMTGFFLVDRDTVDLDDLRPRGFKILLEILARRQMRIGEIPFAFATRFAGESKATFSQGMRFLTQLAMLRFGRMSAFALVGGVGAIANLVIMWGLIHLGMNYLTAAIIASEVTIIGNFLLLEYLVFADMRTGVLVTLAIGFALLACSVGVTQAASVLEDRELIVGLDRLGMPERDLRRARALTVMVPLRWAAVGGALVGAALALPIVGLTVLVAPASLAVIAGTFVAGILLVRLSLVATRPLVTAIRRGV